MPKSKCPECGKALPAGAPAGMCPNCLMQAGLAAASTPARDQAVTIGGPSQEQPGTRIGRYKLLEAIGEGGFGTVWMAEQEEPVRRKVALKIIKLGMDTREVVARFEAERQALAMMEHPNIARVFDGGATENGRPYFVMELVKGVRITDYCDAQKLSTEERLQLFRDVCEAVQHAHQKGIIHRDLKPSNVLVTVEGARPLPKVIDFGIAKATGAKLTDKTFFTGFNQVIGTPVYMSPEQAGLGSLDIDTRSDIYALGVILYELLTGRTPFSKEELARAAFDEVLRTIREKEPPKPSTRLSTLAHEELAAAAAQRSAPPARLSRLLRGELDWIVMKCLEKDRARRYETANGLARDLERYLDDQPVMAAAPGVAYQFAKFARRHRVALSTAAAFALVLIVATAVSTWQAVRATQAEHTQSQLRAVAQAEAIKSREVIQFLQEMLRNIRPRVAQGRDTTLMREITDAAASRLGEELRHQPGTEAELRKIFGTVYRELLQFEKAEIMHRRGLEVARQIGSNQPETLAEALLNLADTLRLQAKLAEAEMLYREGLAVRKKLRDPLALPELYGGLSELYRTQGRRNEAEALNREAIAHWRSAPASDGLARALVTQGGLLRDARRWPEAEAVCREGYEICRDHFPSNTSMVAWLAGDLARVLEPQGKLDEAEFYYRLAFTNSSRTYPNSLKRFFHYQGLARVLTRMGRAAEAESLLQEHADAYQEALGKQVISIESPELITDLVSVIERQGRTNDAGKVVTALLESIPRARWNMSQEDQIEVLAVVAELLVARRRYTEAEPLCREALELHNRVPTTRWHVRPRLAHALARVLMSQDQWATAETYLREAFVEFARRWADQPRLREPVVDDWLVVRTNLHQPVDRNSLLAELTDTNAVRAR